MIDPVQIILLFVIAVLTALLFVLGIQVFFILRELRKTVSTANKVLEDTSVITKSVSGPVSSLSSLTSGLKVGAVVAKLLHKGLGNKTRSGRGKENDE